jgi:hypothetical protein
MQGLRTTRLLEMEILLLNLKTPWGIPEAQLQPFHELLRHSLPFHFCLPHLSIMRDDEQYSKWIIVQMEITLQATTTNNVTPLQRKK